MPRAPNKKVVEGEKLFRDGMPMVDIASRLGVSPSTVRSWKNRYSWGDTKKNKCNVAKKTNATLQKKRGGQPGNKNAKGGRGNPHPVGNNQHGGYSAVYLDALTEDEKKLLDDFPSDIEILLIEQIQLYSIRERRILSAIRKYMDMKGDLAISNISRSERKRIFRDAEEESKYSILIEKQIEAGQRMPGNEYQLNTETTNKDMIIVRLEQELSNIQSKKTKAIEALNNYRIEKTKADNEGASNAVVDDWINAVIEKEGLIEDESSK